MEIVAGLRLRIVSATKVAQGSKQFNSLLLYLPRESSPILIEFLLRKAYNTKGKPQTVDSVQSTLHSTAEAQRTAIQQYGNLAIQQFGS